ncbi:FGGY-family carbohydrate kinase [Faecalicatena acetigenes]|uniref:FGGY-family carbohydrate kinase n=1 Tax=Faecalicatena acetigenes TaxID=2981790 RepID=A0ABT2TD34_9FIRM|nr:MULTISPECIES: FGGY-family carbohydrate kinase [Lachnospiraceae]MCU6748126.1 FGGY-family carbohydrate kinase [Faecalicatena acetigenes]SCI27297.1 L-fuculokinase [uncultured Clostridium sp.]
MDGKIRAEIVNGESILGIEFGSTRIKGVLINGENMPIASGSYEWQNRFENEIWTYHIEDVWTGLQSCYQDLCRNVEEEYGVELSQIKAIGISGMMHGYMAFDKTGRLLVPFRTWRNTMTGQAAEELTELFSYNIPQRWSIAHLYQAILNEEPHVKDIAYLTTLAGYVHWKLTGEQVLGIGEASGMFPVDTVKKQFHTEMLDKFDEKIADKKYPWTIRQILPKVLLAGEEAGALTAKGAALLDPSGRLKAGIPMCPPESDAGTGMTATNSVAKCTGNVSAGTSIFAMIVLEKELDGVYPELDMVTTPAGELVAMVHCNNCTSDINGWAKLFREFTEAVGAKVDMDTLYTTLFAKALEGEADGGGLLSYCYLSGEHITGFDKGCPLFVRTPNSHFNLANFMRVNLMTTLGAIRMGMDILYEKENIRIDKIYGHGGFFKTPEVGQRLLAAAVKAPVSVMETAGEGGAWGIALLAAYRMRRGEEETLETFLRDRVYHTAKENTCDPTEKDVVGFEKFMRQYKNGLAVERAAVENLL